MKIDLTDQIAVSPALPLRRVAIFTASALPLEIVGVPSHLAGAEVVALSVTVVNADGASITAPAEKLGAVWFVTFAPSCFSSYGFVSCGFRATATIRTALDVTETVILAVGDFDIMASAPSATPGDPTRAFQGKGDDIYVKTRVVNGVQHFAKQTVAYNDRLQSYAAEWSGDYILVNGDFQEVTE